VVMVQEYADGGDLFSLLQKHGGRLSEKVAVQMVLDPFLRVLQVRRGGEGGLSSRQGGRAARRRPAAARAPRPLLKPLTRAPCAAAPRLPATTPKQYLHTRSIVHRDIKPGEAPPFFPSRGRARLRPPAPAPARALCVCPCLPPSPLPAPPGLPRPPSHHPPPPPPQRTSCSPRAAASSSPTLASPSTCGRSAP
jgi:hypothetical protein